MAKKIEELQADIDALHTEKAELQFKIIELQEKQPVIESLQTENAELKAKLEAAGNASNDVDELQAKLEATEAEKQVLEKVNIELTSKVQELSAEKPATPNAPKAPVVIEGKSFEVDGEQWGFNYPKTVFDKTPITADDVVASQDLQRKLIAAESTMIKRI